MSESSVRKRRRTVMAKNFATLSLRKCLQITAVDFQRMIRIEAAGPDGMCQCVTCGQRVHWKACDAGHFHSRRHKGSLLSELNCHPQCKSCNQFDNGSAKANYQKFMERTYTEQQLIELEALKKLAELTEYVN